MALPFPIIRIHLYTIKPRLINPFERIMDDSPKNNAKRKENPFSTLEVKCIIL